MGKWPDGHNALACQPRNARAWAHLRRRLRLMRAADLSRQAGTGAPEGNWTPTPKSPGAPLARYNTPREASAFRQWVARFASQFLQRQGFSRAASASGRRGSAPAPLPSLPDNPPRQYADTASPDPTGSICWFAASCFPTPTMS